MKIDNALIMKFREVLTCKFGIQLNRKSDDFFQNIVLESEFLKKGMKPQHYLEQLLHDDLHADWQRIIDAITIPETYFFRNPDQFRYLEKVIIPDMIRQKSVSRWQKMAIERPKIRILSAACSTGEEAYSVAMSLMHQIKYSKGWDILIEASDISQSRLKIAQQGSYRQSTRLLNAIGEINPGYLADYFETTECDKITVVDEIKNMVVFKLHNLMTWLDMPRSMLPKYDIIFCRNVMIYFSTVDQARLVAMLERLLGPGGYLMLGDSETLHPFHHNLRLVTSSTGLIYQDASHEGDIL